MLEKVSRPVLKGFYLAFEEAAGDGLCVVHGGRVDEVELGGRVGSGRVHEGAPVARGRGAAGVARRACGDHQRSSSGARASDDVHGTLCTVLGSGVVRVRRLLLVDEGCCHGSGSQRRPQGGSVRVGHDLTGGVDQVVVNVVVAAKIVLGINSISIRFNRGLKMPT